MREKLARKVSELIEGPNFAQLATLMPDGSPQVTTVWIDHDGEIIRVNTAKGRVKYINVMRDPRVAISITRHKNPYEQAVIRGRVIEVTEDEAEEHIDQLSRKYTGADFQKPSGQKRVIIKIRPTKVTV
ncbi:MAG: PPOX class F420-dependent oxidoreductase [Candidatus Geothermarchaeales archaeon]